MTEERGNLIAFRTISGHWMERLERAAAVEFGGSASSTEFSMTAAQARGATVRDSVSLAIRIGEAVSRAQESPVDALIAELGAAEADVDAPQPGAAIDQLPALPVPYPDPGAPGNDRRAEFEVIGY